MLEIVDELTRRISTSCYWLYRSTQSYSDLSYDDYQQLARGTAFVTLAEHYGPEDLPADLPEELVIEGRRRLSHELSGPGSEVYDYIRRTASSPRYGRGHRRDFMVELQDAWSALNHTLPHLEIREDWIGDMLHILQTQLPAHQFQLLEACYLRNTSRTQLAQEMVDTSPRYQTQNGFRRALTCVDTKLCRARAAARALLGQRFALHAQEISA